MVSEMKNKEKLIQNLIRKDFIKSPQLFEKGDNIEEYIQRIADYCKAIGAGKEDESYILLNNLSSDAKNEILSLPEYYKNSTNSEWITEQLLRVFYPKCSEISPLIELLKIKQSNHQTIREFASELRVKAYKLMGHKNPHKKEKYILIAFQKGLRNRYMASALKAMAPQSVEEAVELIKRETVLSDSCLENDRFGEDDQVNALEKETCTNHIDEIKKEIQFLKERINLLVTLVSRGHQQGLPSQGNNLYRKYQSTQRNTSFNNNYQSQATANKFDQRCYNCNGIGHIARNCRQKCRICNSPGHTSDRCQQRFQKKSVTNKFSKLRQIEDGSSLSADDSDTQETHDETVCTLEVSNVRKKQTTKTN